MHGFLTAAVLLLVLAISTNHVDARAGGAPSAACRDMRPQHGNSNGVDPVPYTVATNVGPSYNFSTTYTGNTSLLVPPAPPPPLPCGGILHCRNMQTSDLSGQILHG